MLAFVACCVLSSFWTSFLVVATMRWLAPRLGLIDKPAARKFHKHPTPLGGGVGIWLGVLLPLVGAQLILWQLINQPPAWAPPTLVAAWSGGAEKTTLLWAMLAAGSVLAVVGFLDDFRPLPWQPRLLLQAAIGLFVAWMGVRATFFVASGWGSVALTVAWIVVLVNSFNFLDNMDGLSAGIGLVASSLFAAMMLLRADDPRWLVGGFFLLLSGALLGFLAHNWSPARIFMGDAGAYFLGFCMATMTILGTFYQPGDLSEHVILAPLCVLAVPLYDITSVVYLRLREGRSPFQPDKRHFSHRLVGLGLKPVYAVLTIHLATLTTGLAGLLLYFIPSWQGASIALAGVVCVLAIIAILESAPRSPKDAE